MAAPFTDTPKVGVDLKSVVLGTDLTASNVRPSAKLGSEVFGSDGKLYVYAQANGSITASTAVCTVLAGTFLATNSGGAYTSPASNMVSGDQAWFGKASV